MRSRDGGLDLEADDRATLLLLSMLTPEQRASWRRTGHFNVVKGKYRYRIGMTLQVRVYVGTRLLENWCAYLANCPQIDTIIAQLLLLRDDPKKLRDMAEVTSLTDAWMMPFERQERRRGEITAYVRRIIQRAGYTMPDAD